jgi:predicted negative regulator of RcsB-dependent stress response
VDEYLSEKEQIEKIRVWLRENGLFLIAGVGLGLLGLFGMNRYEAYVASRGESAAALWLAAQEAIEESRIDDAEAALAELKAKHAGNGYTDNTALLLASAILDAEPAAAAAELRYVMENSEDPNTALIARERLARVLAFDERYDEALAMLDVKEPGAFEARFNEIAGDTHYARGAFDEARRSYIAAMAAPGSDLVDRQFLQVKLLEVIATVDERAAASDAASAAVEGEQTPAGVDTPSTALATEAEAGAERAAEPADTARAEPEVPVESEAEAQQ